MNYRDYFERLTGDQGSTGHPPFPYQSRLAEGPWPEVLDIPTGLGKTAAVVIAWLWRRLEADARTGRRLVYCLPMRSLVSQTAEATELWCSAAAPMFEAKSLLPPRVHVLMGGDVDQSWDLEPERPAVLVGTQDMLLSRALNRGYAMSRYRWPMHFGLLSSDCLWVLDETQLIGVGVETSAQLQGLAADIGTQGPRHTLWMSATLGEAQLDTVDHRRPEVGFTRCELAADDRDLPVVHRRLSAAKPIEPLPGVRLESKADAGYAKVVAASALAAHIERPGLTLIVVNSVERAQRIYTALDGKADVPVALVHSRFRSPDRQRHEQVLHSDGERIVVATQAVEAGVDVSAHTLITELAPWSSLVQRFGRCNRYGEYDDARVYWVDAELDAKGETARPYEPRELEQARAMLEAISDVGPAALQKVDWTAPPIVRPVLRRRDLLELFDTTPDLTGEDVDVSRFIRDGDDTDVRLYYRAFEGEGPHTSASAPTRDELCRVSLFQCNKFADALKKRRAKAKPGSPEKSRLALWRWYPLERTWKVATPRPGLTLLVHPVASGYDAKIGWTGDKSGDVALVELPEPHLIREAMDDDAATDIGRWVTLAAHLRHVSSSAEALTSGLGLTGEHAEAVITAASWHDLGKVHSVFVQRLLGPLEPDELPDPALGPWAKSNHQRRSATSRPYFRHELASALGWLADSRSRGALQDLVAYLIAAHHGKVRLSIRSLPDEAQPSDRRLYARGVWDGDILDPVQVPGCGTVGPTRLDLSVLPMGQGSWLERMLGLRDDMNLGPFRLAYLETLVRVADARASRAEQRGEYDDV